MPRRSARLNPNLVAAHEPEPKSMAAMQARIGSGNREATPNRNDHNEGYHREIDSSPLYLRNFWPTPSIPSDNNDPIPDAVGDVDRGVDQSVDEGRILDYIVIPREGDANHDHSPIQVRVKLCLSSSGSHDDGTWVSERSAQEVCPGVVFAFWRGHHGGRDGSLGIDANPDTQYEILRVCGERTVLGKPEYRVEWVGYPEKS